MFGILGGIFHSVQAGLCWVLTTVGTVPAEALKHGLNVAKSIVCGGAPDA